MNKLEQLLAKLATIDTQINEANDKISAILVGEAITAEQRAEHDALVASVKKHEADRGMLSTAIEAEEKRIDREKQSADRRTAQRPRPITDAGSPAAQPQENTTGDLLPGIRSAGQIPYQVRKIGRVGGQKNFKGTINGMSAQERAYRFGMWVLAKATIEMPSRYRFRAAIQFVEKYMTASNETDATGNYNLIPEEFGVDIIDLREKYGVARKIFKNVPMIAETRTDPRRDGGLTAYFVSEGGAGTESNKVWSNVRLTAKEVMVLSRYTNQLNADAAINIGDDLIGEIAYAYANKEDDCAMNGDASSTYGRIRGVRKCLADVDLAGTASAGLKTMTGNAWSSCTLKDLQGVVAVLPQYADTERACWVCHRAFYYNVMQVLELAAGGVTALEVQQGDRRPRPLFLGYPVQFSQIWPSTSAATQVSAALGDFYLGASLGDRQAEEIAFSEHASVGGENVFERNQIAIRGIERMDINVHDVGTSSAAGPIVGITT